jgi:Holliday junction DNA helicase RuvA
VLDVNGVGYELDVPMSTFYNLPAAGDQVADPFRGARGWPFLYGFLTEAERFAFRQLLKVSGIGARTRCRCSPACRSAIWRLPWRSRNSGG